MNAFSVRWPVIFMREIVGTPDRNAFVAKDLRAVCTVINSHFLWFEATLLPPRVIDFTTTWCIWCTRQEPQVVDLHKKYESKGFTVIAIDCNEPRETVLSKYPGGTNLYPVVLDLDGNVSRNQYGVQGFPFYLLVDKTGKVAYVQSGFKEDMFKSVSKIIDYLMDKEP